MLNSTKLSLVLFLFSLVTVSTILGASKKRETFPYLPKPQISLPKLPQLVPLYNSDFFKLSFKNRITPISDFFRSIEFSDMPEEYDIWSDTKINPYQVSLVDMKDTVKIDLSGYNPPVLKYVTSDFGFRKWRHHYGIDLKVNKGDSVHCAFDGVIRITKRVKDYGYYVLIRHFNGLETLYAHLSKIVVNPGDTIKAGNTLGLGGSTGRSTGCHLHFETRYLGNPINPNDLIDFNSHTVKNNIFLLNSQNFAYKKEIDKIRFWVIRKGDTLGKIAIRTGVSISKLCSLNGIKKTSTLRIGRKLRYT
ncbi:MAG: M23 family metallopeptidase [Rikenellaceae bacterium]